jgi:histidine triad (HIT) family protein
MKDCLFCKIASKEISSKIVYENDFVIAFNDINPVAPIHVLVIPKRHIQDLNGVDTENEKYVIECIKAIKEVAKLTGIDEDGYRVISNTGENGGQVIHHLHFHVIGGKHLGENIVN